MEYDLSQDCFTDPELGLIKVSRAPRARIHINFRTNGDIVLVAWLHAPEVAMRRYIELNRGYILANIKLRYGSHRYHDGDKIGRQHTISIKSGARATTKVNDHLTIVTIPDSMSQREMSQYVHSAVAKTLRREASRYLPKRLHFFADKYGYRYETVRLTFAKSRWGSCSARGTISLNIALMSLPEELRDYVLLHELAHTKEMNHSADFWRQLESTLPNARELNDRLRDYQPYI